MFEEKLNKVIAGMEACNGVGDDCNSCPYAGEGERCSGVLWSDILNVLREYRSCLIGCGIRQYGREVKK